MNVSVSQSNRATKIRWILAGLVLFSFTWRIQNLAGQSLWRDEVDAIYFAQRELPDLLSMFIDAGQNGALYFLALRPWLRLMGSSEFALRYASVLCGVLAVPLLWQVSKKLIPNSSTKQCSGGKGLQWAVGRRSSGSNLWSELLGDTPLIAATFLAINPYHLWYSQEGKMYALITLLSLLAAWFWLQGIDGGGRWSWFVFFVTVTIAIYSHLLQVVLIALYCAWMLLSWPQSSKYSRGYFLSLAGLTLPYVPLLLWQWDLLVANKQQTAISFTPLPDVLRTVLLYQSSSFLQPRGFIYLIPIIALVLIAVCLGNLAIAEDARPSLARLSNVRRHLLIVTWFVVPILIIYLLSLRQPVFQPRYIIWITPAAMMLMALGVRLVWQSRGKLNRTLAATLFIYIIAYWGSVGWQAKSQTIKTDLRGAISYVHEHRQPQDLLILQIPHIQYAYRYYSSDQNADPFHSSDERLGWWSAGASPDPDLNNDDARQQVEQYMRFTTFGATTVWVLLSEVELADPNHLMNEWLSQNMTLIEDIHFLGIQVQRYQDSSYQPLTDRTAAGSPFND